MATLEERLSELITELGTDYVYLVDQITAVSGLALAAKPFYITFGRAGTLATFTGPRLYFPDDVELMEATFSLTTAPTGSSAIFEVLKNGSGTHSSDPTISASGFLASAGTLSGTTTFTDRTDYLQISCSQVGSTIAGADLAVSLKMRLV